MCLKKGRKKEKNLPCKFAQFADLQTCMAAFFSFSFFSSVCLHANGKELLDQSDADDACLENIPDKDHADSNYSFLKVNGGGFVFKSL